MSDDHGGTAGAGGEQDAQGMGGETGEVGDAARRGMQRAGVHLMRAAIEVVAGLSAFLEEMQAAGVGDDDRDEDEGPEHIEVE